MAGNLAWAESFFIEGTGIFFIPGTQRPETPGRASRARGCHDVPSQGGQPKLGGTGGAQSFFYRGNWEVSGFFIEADFDDFGLRVFS